MAAKMTAARMIRCAMAKALSAAASETILQRQLQLPHRLRAGDDAECRRTEVIGGRRIVVSLIERIESLEAHVQLVALPDFDIPRKRRIHRPRPDSIQRIAALI